MRLVLAAALLAALFAAVPAMAADTTTPAWECNVGIKSGSAQGNRPCTAVTIRQDVPNGRTTLIFAFADGFRLEVGGPALMAGAEESSLIADRIAWANPGQTELQVDANAAGSRIVRGHCVIARFRDDQGLAAIGCKLGGSLGRIGVAFKGPRPPKKR